MQNSEPRMQRLERILETVDLTKKRKNEVGSTKPGST